MCDVSTKRIIAFFIDLGLIWVCFVVINNFSPVNITIKEFKLVGFQFIIGFSFFFLIYYIYFVLMDFLNAGESIGKRIVHIGVVSKSNTILDNRALLKRTFFKTIGYIFLPISVVVFLYNQNTIQDKVCLTKTINVD